ncbi:ATP-binding protein [Bacteriovoracales bacterium]|nr:ATP-binding protein [Bacteriovoracales bacterium]
MKFLSNMIETIAEGIGKKVSYEVVEEKDSTTLMDAIVHILRNSLVESKGERLNAGKSEIGKIKVSLNNKNLSISIEDDGRGIDHSIITKKEMAKGITPTLYFLKKK